METTFESYLPNGFHCYYKSKQFLPVQNEVELLQIGEAIKKRGRFITNRGSYYKSGQLLQIGAQKMSVVGGSFSLKLKTISMSFEINSFCNILKDNVQGQVSLLLEVLEVAFLGDNALGTISSPKSSRNCLWWSDFLIKTQAPDYSQQA